MTIDCGSKSGEMMLVDTVTILEHLYSHYFIPVPLCSISVKQIFSEKIKGLSLVGVVRRVSLTPTIFRLLEISYHSGVIQERIVRNTNEKQLANLFAECYCENCMLIFPTVSGELTKEGKEFLSKHCQSDNLDIRYHIFIIIFFISGH
jgi:hypothetical protein